jgi:mutator protein MutT
VQEKQLVVAVLIRKGAEILMMQRRGGSMNGRWFTPGGKVDPGESWQDAAKREVREEVGLDIEPTKIIHTVDRDNGFIIHVVECDVDETQTPINCEPNKASMLKYYAPSAITALDLGPADLDFVKSPAFASFHKEDSTPMIHESDGDELVSPEAFVSKMRQIAANEERRGREFEDAWRTNYGRSANDAGFPEELTSQLCSGVAELYSQIASLINGIGGQYLAYAEEKMRELRDTVHKPILEDTGK